MMYASTSGSVLPIAKSSKTGTTYSKAMQVETGLANLGNTCFMNSSLQLLLHIEPLVNYFRSGQHTADLNRKSPTRGEVANSFFKLIQDIEANSQQKSQGISTASSVSPVELQKAVGNFAPYLMDYSQQDCQEFLRFLLDGLGEDLKRPDKSVSSSPMRGIGSGMKTADSCPSLSPTKSGLAIVDAGTDDCVCASLPVSPTKLSLAEKLRLETLNTRGDPKHQQDTQQHRQDEHQYQNQLQIQRRHTSNNNDEEIDDPNEYITRQNGHRGDTGNHKATTTKSNRRGGSGNQETSSDSSDTDDAGSATNASEVLASESKSVAVADPVPVTTTTAVPTPLDCAAQADKSWQDYVRKNDSIITDIFAGQLQSTVECLFCNHKSYTFDPFLDLSVPVPSASKRIDHTTGLEKGMSMLHNTARSVSTYVSNATTRITPWRIRAQPPSVPLDPSAYPIKTPSVGSKDAGGSADFIAGSVSGGPSASKCTLDDCLKQFTAEEMLDHENMYLCEKCNQRRKCSKTLKIVRYPKVLVIHLNRFRYSAYSREKVHTDVKFPTKGLNINPFMQGSEAIAVSAVPDAGPSSAQVQSTLVDPLSATCSISARDEDPATSPAVDNDPRSAPLPNGASSVAPANALPAINASVDNCDTVSSTSVSTDAGNAAQSKASSAVLYDLAGISHHSGSMSGGHYIAHINIATTANSNNNNSASVGGVEECSYKSDTSIVDGNGLGTNRAEGAGTSGNNGLPASKWMCFNDARVSTVSSSAIGGPTAYVLFYNLREPASTAVNSTESAPESVPGSLSRVHAGDAPGACTLDAISDPDLPSVLSPILVSSQAEAEDPAQ